VAAVDGGAGDEAPRAAGAGSTGRKKVLVIDDSPLIVDLVRHAVEMQGKYTVVVAYDGVEGLEQYYRERPDCVIVDVMMPQMDGFQFVRCLRGDAETSQVPLIILTALTTPDKELTGYLSGADEFLTKPFRPSVLCATLDRVLAMTPEERARRLMGLADGESS
jgi:two-component system alkaline phosphatase synthesis response regulator PhoP